MKSQDTETAKELKKQLDNCFKWLDDESAKYNGLLEPLNIFNIARFINKQLYWHYDFISNYEYLTNSEQLNQKINDLIVIHTQFLLNAIKSDLDTENTIKSVINEITNNRYMKDIKPLKKEIKTND